MTDKTISGTEVGKEQPAMNVDMGTVLTEAKKVSCPRCSAKNTLTGKGQRCSQCGAELYA